MGRSGISLKDWCITNNRFDLIDHLKDKTIADNVSFASHKELDWICDKGHPFKRSPMLFTSSVHNIGKFTCPYCVGQKVLKGYNDLATIRPDLVSEWDFDKNGILPTEVTANSHKKVNWVCSNNHTWVAKIYSRAGSNNGCPYCSNIVKTSLGEQYLFYYVSKAFSNCTVINNYKLNGVEFDVFVLELNLAFEFDGMYWHSIRNTDYKFNFAKENNIVLYKVLESDSLHNDDYNFYYSVFYNIVKSDYNICLYNLFNNLLKHFSCLIPDINLERDYAVVRNNFNSNQSKVKRNWIDKLRPYWDEKLNGYCIESMLNDCTDKYWRCDIGHSFKRRLDVIDKSGKLVCPCCTNKYTWRFYCFRYKGDYYILDMLDNSLEFIKLADIRNCMLNGINIRGMSFEGFDSDYLARLSDSTIRDLFLKFIHEDIKPSSGAEELAFVLMNGLRNNSIKKFHESISHM